MSSFSALWRPEKAISAVSLNKRFKGTYFRVSSFSAFWGHENAIFAESCNPLFKGTSLSLSRFSSFLRIENAIFPRLETHGSREHTFVRVHFLHFGVLKMRLLRSHETYGAKECEGRVSSWSAFWGLQNTISAESKGDVAFCSPENANFAFCSPENENFAGS